MIKTISKKKKCKKAKWLSDEGLQIAEQRREVKTKGEKERYTHLNAEFQRISEKWKSRVQKLADSYFLGGWMLRKFQGENLRSD